MNSLSPIITNAAAYPTFISYASEAFSLTPLSGDTGWFIFLITLYDQFNASIKADFYFEININENSPPFFVQSHEQLVGLALTNITNITLPGIWDD